jgi:hypothetical protein
MTPELRSQRARIAALTRWSREDPGPATKKARDGFNASFEREVDPEGILPEPERLRRAEAAKKAHFARLAMRSAKARARKTGGQDAS